MINIPAIKECPNYRSLTAAILFVAMDSTFTIIENSIKKSFQRTAEAEYESAKVFRYRQKIAKNIFRYLKKECLTKDEFEIFDISVILFSKAMRGDIALRGDWIFNDYSPTGAFSKAFVCYGDLLNNPDCLYNYENAPIFIRPIENSLRFMTDIIESKKLIEKLQEQLQERILFVLFKYSGSSRSRIE